MRPHARTVVVASLPAAPRRRVRLPATTASAPAVTSPPTPSSRAAPSPPVAASPRATTSLRGTRPPSPTRPGALMHLPPRRPRRQAHQTRAGAARSVAALLVLALAGACLFSPSPTPCRADRNCPDDLVCEDGACATPTDAGVRDDDAGAPGDDDAGAPDDAGVECLVLASLTIDDEDAMDVLVGETCARIEGALTVQPFFGDLERLAPVIAVGGDVVVQGTNGLARLDGMENIASIGGDLVLSSNNLLNDVEALHGASVDGDVTVQDNSVLRTCDALALVEAIEANGLGGASTVQGNLFDGCS